MRAEFVTKARNDDGHPDMAQFARMDVSQLRTTKVWHRLSSLKRQLPISATRNVQDLSRAEFVTQDTKGVVEIDDEMNPDMPELADDSVFDNQRV